MAKGKIIDLGLVIKIHPSGMCETEKGRKVFIKADKGDRIKMDSKQRKPYIFVAKTTNKVVDPTALPLGDNEGTGDEEK